jgi:hypothetical protein
MSSKHITTCNRISIYIMLVWCRCGHCKRMVGEYKTLGELVQSDPALKNRVVVAKVCAGPSSFVMYLVFFPGRICCSWRQQDRCCSREGTSVGCVATGSMHAQFIACSSTHAKHLSAVSRCV